MTPLNIVLVLVGWSALSVLVVVGWNVAKWATRHRYDGRHFE